MTQDAADKQEPLMRARVLKLCAWVLAATVVTTMLVFMYFHLQVVRERNRLLTDMQGNLQELVEQVNAAE